MNQIIRTEKIDPKDYPFKKIIDENAHLDTEELRHTIETIVHTLPIDFVGEEHLYCDKSQLDEHGKWIDPHASAKAKGFKTMMEMNDAIQRQKKDDDTKSFDDLKKQIADLTALVLQMSKPPAALAANGF